MFSIFKRKGLTYKERISNDFENAKGAIKKGDTLSDRDRKMIAVGRAQVHGERQEYRMYKYPEKYKKETHDRHKQYAVKRQKKTDAWKKKNGG